MSQNPFKLHPLPPTAPSDSDDFGLDLEESDEDLEGGAELEPTSHEEAMAVAEALVLAYLARASLLMSIRDLPAFADHTEPVGYSDALRRRVVHLRDQRHELQVELELSDISLTEPQAQIDRVAVERLPVLIGRETALVQLDFVDPDLPPLKGYLYQIGAHLIYQDLGTSEGTLLERSIGGKVQLLNLKGEPCPLRVGDRLVLGGVQTALTVRSLLQPPRETRLRRILGIGPPYDDQPPGEPVQTKAAPRADRPLSVAPSVTEVQEPSAAGTMQLLFGFGLVVAGLLLGRLTAPEPPPVIVQATPPPQATPITLTETLRVGPSLEVTSDERLRLVSPKLPESSYFFLLTGEDPEQPDPYLRGVPFALGQVSDGEGAAAIVYAPAGISRSLLATSPAQAVDTDDPRLNMFLALRSLQQGQLEQAGSVLERLAAGEAAPLIALKGAALVAIEKQSFARADQLLQAGMEQNASDPELHFLNARLAMQRALRLPEESRQRTVLIDDARASYEEALRQWLLPPSTQISFRGHELGLSGESLLDEYQQLLTRLLALPQPPAGEGEQAPGSPGANAGAEDSSGAVPGATGGSAASTVGPGAASSARSSGHALARIPAGEFIMGGDIAAPADEQGLQEKIGLKAYQIDLYEVSNAHFERVFPEHRTRRGPSTGDNDPVVQVTWDEASQYCRTVGLRLPTEAEWEKAARGVDGRIYPWGSEDVRASLLNYRESRIGRPSAVDSYPEGASPYGVLNMAGNVWEWTADWYDPAYYQQAPRRNPVGPPDGSRRVIRGGSFQDGASDARASNRASTPPAMGIPKLGFRCARDG